MENTLHYTALTLAKATVDYYRCKQALEAEDSPINQRRLRNAYADMMDTQEELASLARDIAGRSFSLDK